MDKPRSKNESAVDPDSGLLPGRWAWAWAWAWVGSFVPGQLVFKFWSPELGDGMDRGVNLGAQEGHLSPVVADLAKFQTPRLLWKGSCQGLPGLLAEWQPHSGNGEKMGFGKWHWAVLQHPLPAPGSAHWISAALVLSCHHAGPAPAADSKPGCCLEKLSLPYFGHITGRQSAQSLSGPGSSGALSLQPVSVCLTHHSSCLSAKCRGQVTVVNSPVGGPGPPKQRWVGWGYEGRLPFT